MNFCLYQYSSHVFSLSKLDQLDSSSAPKGARNHASATQPIPIHTYCGVRRDSHPLTLPTQKWAAKLDPDLPLPPSACFYSADARCRGTWVRDGGPRRSCVRDVPCHAPQQVDVMAAGRERGPQIFHHRALRVLLFSAFLRSACPAGWDPTPALVRVFLRLTEVSSSVFLSALGSYILSYFS